MNVKEIGIIVRNWNDSAHDRGYCRALVNAILREYLGPIRMRMGSGEGSTMKNFIVCSVHLI